jgi:hypothetical protein
MSGADVVYHVAIVKLFRDPGPGTLREELNDD